MSTNGVTRIGLISDTHGLLREGVEQLFSGVSHILHAGDVGELSVLKELEKIAPVTAVRGNMDQGSWADILPFSASLEICGRRVYMLHMIETLDVEPTQFDLIVYGHTHRPNQHEMLKTLLINPGSAGPRRGLAPPTVAILTLRADGIATDYHTLVN